MPCLLVVEDNPADVMLAETALAELDPRLDVHSVADGGEALDFLHRRGPHANAPRCDLILLDLNLPGMDGHGLLERLRHDQELRHMPVAVWSSSYSRADVVRAYDNGANAYYRKRADYSETLDLMRLIAEHWFGAAQLPTASQV